MGRKRVKIFESKALCRLLLLVSRGINYAQAISKETGNKPSPIVKQLKILEKTGYLNKPKKEKLLNKSIYSVNYKKILDEFIEYYIGSLVTHYDNQEFPVIKKELSPKIEEIRKYLLSIKDNEILISAIDELLSFSIKEKSSKEKLFFFLSWYLEDLAEGKVKNSKGFKELGKLLKNLEEEYHKEVEKAKGKWINEFLKKSKS